MVLSIPSWFLWLLAGAVAFPEEFFVLLHPNIIMTFTCPTCFCYWPAVGAWLLVVEAVVKVTVHQKGPRVQNLATPLKLQKKIVFERVRLSERYATSDGTQTRLTLVASSENNTRIHDGIKTHSSTVKQGTCGRYCLNYSFVSLLCKIYVLKSIMNTNFSSLCVATLFPLYVFFVFISSWLFFLSSSWNFLLLL